MLPLRGLGIWIWELDKCEGGNVAAIVAKAKASGVAWVVAKCGEETPDGQVTTALVAAFKAAGIRFAAWWYCRPKDFASQIAMLKDLADRCGVDAFVMDAEVEWDAPDQRATAATFAKSLRAALGPDVFLADAPWARPVWHGSPFPYAAFGAVMDARMPQFYWMLAEVAGESYTKFVASADMQWAQTDPAHPICPALSTVNEDGTKHAPPSELNAALDRYGARAAVSIWSWQHLTAAEWALLEQRARAATAAANQPIPNPLAGIPVPGIDPDAETT